MLAASALSLFQFPIFNFQSTLSFPHCFVSGLNASLKAVTLFLQTRFVSFASSVVYQHLAWT